MELLLERGYGLLKDLGLLAKHLEHVSGLLVVRLQDCLGLADLIELSLDYLNSFLVHHHLLTDRLFALLEPLG